MFSNDNNIETIAQLVEELKKYVTLKGEYFKLGLVEKTVKILTALVMTFILAVLLLLAIIFLSFSLAFALGSLVGQVLGFLIVGGIYILLLIVVVSFRKAWIERPLVKFLANTLME